MYTQEMERRGIGISMEGGDALRKRLDPSVDTAILEALDKVCSGNLTFQPLPREPQEPYVSMHVFPYPLTCFGAVTQITHSPSYCSLDPLLIF